MADPLLDPELAAAIDDACASATDGLAAAIMPAVRVELDEQTPPVPERVLAHWHTDRRDGA